MAIQKYDELLAAVRDYTMRDNLPFDTLLTLAEAKMNPIIKHYLQQKTYETDSIHPS